MQFIHFTSRLSFVVHHHMGASVVANLLAISSLVIRLFARRASCASTRRLPRKIKQQNAKWFRVNSAKMLQFKCHTIKYKCTHNINYIKRILFYKKSAIWWQLVHVMHHFLCFMLLCPNLSVRCHLFSALHNYRLSLLSSIASILLIIKCERLFSVSLSLLHLQPPHPAVSCEWIRRIEKKKLLRGEHPNRNQWPSDLVNFALKIQI